MANNQSELTVITNAKRLADYVFAVTQKSPKSFRMTLVMRMQNLTLDVIDRLYRANDVYVTEKHTEAYPKRLELQKRALTDLKLLGYMAELSSGMQCILPKQFEQICIHIAACQNTLLSWMKSDYSRFTKTE